MEIHVPMYQIVHRDAKLSLHGWESNFAERSERWHSSCGWHKNRCEGKQDWLDIIQEVCLYERWNSYVGLYIVGHMGHKNVQITHIRGCFCEEWGGACEVGSSDCDGDQWDTSTAATHIRSNVADTICKHRFQMMCLLNKKTDMSFSCIRNIGTFSTLLSLYTIIAVICHNFSCITIIILCTSLFSCLFAGKYRRNKFPA